MALSEWLREANGEKASTAFEVIGAGDAGAAGRVIVALQNEIGVPQLHARESGWLQGGTETADSAISKIPEDMGVLEEWMEGTTPYHYMTDPASGGRRPRD